MGRSFSYKVTVEKYITKFFYNNSSQKDIQAYSILHKLGYTNFFKALLLNPKVGYNHKELLQKIILEGHELGLHGGKNHATWERYLKKWYKKEIDIQIEYGLMCFEQLGLPKPQSFASPCWQTSDVLNQSLLKHGFSIVADTYSSNGFPYRDNIGLLQCPTNILAKEPTVGFIENLRVLGYTSKQILHEFERQLDREGDYKMVFDHPFYVGIKEIELLSEMLEICVVKGYQVQSLENICKKINEDFTHLS
ncbi:hypothetical protein GCM10007424_10910 [Flavobacterium suaedae]|uniref:NodB homology domain-containing protein n=2 Tax=Flavobacterium suaedae TaxID=1767027 RepID=A0ABQ1JRI1_9FLAO|nr:hypothetical protein GCM10007424_10910 [Flavobacterium suaedae]